MTQAPSDSELDRATDTEYAAISILAVVGLLFSLLGAIALFLPAAFLIILPATGLVLSALALRHIRRSNGVLTGRWVAIAGIAVGGSLALAASGSHFLVWHEKQRELDHLQASSLDVVDLLAAGDYGKILERIPKERRGSDDATANVLRERFSKLFAGGPMTARKLVSLDVQPTEKGDRMAVARVQGTLQSRGIEITLVWSNATTPSAPPGTWQLVGAFGEETLESATKPDLEHAHDHEAEPSDRVPEKGV